MSSFCIALQWRHNEYGGSSFHQRLDGLHKRLFRRRSKETPKLRVTGLSMTREFPSQRSSKRKKFPSDDVIMIKYACAYSSIEQYRNFVGEMWLNISVNKRYVLATPCNNLPLNKL